jgi:hypothetical protein
MTAKIYDGGIRAHSEPIVCNILWAKDTDSLEGKINDWFIKWDQSHKDDHLISMSMDSLSLGQYGFTNFMCYILYSIKGSTYDKKI